MRTTKQPRFLALAFLLSLAIAAGCGGSGPGGLAAKSSAPQVLRGVDPLTLAPDAQHGALAVQLRLDEGAKQRLGAKALPNDAARVDISFSGGPLSSAINVSVHVEEFVNGIAQFVITNLPGGTISVSATVKDGANTTLASGSQNVTVVVGQVTPVNLLLSTSSATGTGQVSLLVDTRPSATPSPSASIPATPGVPTNGTLTAVVAGNLGPQLVFMDPAVGATGATIRLTGTGFGRFPGLSTVTFDGVPAKTYTAFPDAESNTALLWHMDNDTNVQFVHDDSGNPNDGNIGGAYGNSFNVAIVEGRMGKARSFNGANDTIWFGDHSSLNFSNGITIEGWIKPADITTNANYHIFRQSGSNAKLLAFQGNGTILSFGLTVGGTYSELDVSISASQWVDSAWHYVAATFDGSTKKLYRDGVLIGSQSVSGTITANSEAYQVGSWDGWQELYKGEIDEFRLSKVARSASDIAAHWNANQNWSNVQILVPVPAGVSGSNKPVKVQVGPLVSNSLNFSVQ